MKLAIFFLSDVVNEATLFNYNNTKKLLTGGGHDIDLYWAVHSPTTKALETNNIEANFIRVSTTDIMNFGLFDNMHYKPLWKNNDYFLYYLAAQVSADFSIVLEGDYFINDVQYFKSLVEKIENVDYILQWHGETAVDSDYYWKNYTSKEELGYEAPYFLTNKNIMGAKSEIINKLLHIRREQSLLTTKGIKIPNDNFFFGMQLVKDKSLKGLFMGDNSASMPLVWNDSKYYLDEDVLNFRGTVHPIRTAQEAILSNIIKGAIIDKDFYDNSSYLNTILIPNALKENREYVLPYEATKRILDRLNENEGISFLRQLTKQKLLPIITNRSKYSDFYNRTVDEISSVSGKIKFAIDTLYQGLQYPQQLDFSNIALFRPVVLSSKWGRSLGKLATDGNVDPRKYIDGGFHTDFGKSEFAVIDLQNETHVSYLRLFHRQGHFERTKDLEIFISTDGSEFESVSILNNIDWLSLETKTTRNSEGIVFFLEIEINVAIRYIKIVNQTPGNVPLHLNQIEVFQ